jgi:hypothetical protein
MTMIGHGLGVYAPQSRTKELQQVVAAYPGYAEYLAENWRPVAEALEEGHAERIVAAIERVLLRLGLRFEDLPDGRVHLHVTEPHACLGAEQVVSRLAHEG